jgi:hypothetical protein
MSTVLANLKIPSLPEHAGTLGGISYRNGNWRELEGSVKCSGQAHGYQSDKKTMAFVCFNYRHFSDDPAFARVSAAAGLDPGRAGS